MSITLTEPVGRIVVTSSSVYHSNLSRCAKIIEKQGIQGYFNSGDREKNAVRITTFCNETEFKKLLEELDSQQFSFVGKPERPDFISLTGLYGHFNQEEEFRQYLKDCGQIIISNADNIYWYSGFKDSMRDYRWKFDNKKAENCCGNAFVEKMSRVIKVGSYSWDWGHMLVDGILGHDWNTKTYSYMTDKAYWFRRKHNIPYYDWEIRKPKI